MKKLKAVYPSKPRRHKALIKAQFAITYVDSSICDPLGRPEPLVNSFVADGQIVQPLPRKFKLLMVLRAVPVGKGKAVDICFLPDIMNGGKLFHRPYTKEKIKKMRAEEKARERKEAEEYRDYDD